MLGKYGEETNRSKPLWQVFCSSERFVKGGEKGGIGVHKSALFCFFDPRVHPTGVRNGTNLSNY